MKDYATEIAPGTIRFERYMPGPIGRIWDYLTHPTIRGQWLAQGPMETRDDGRFELTFRVNSLTAHNETAPEGRSDNAYVVSGRVKECKYPNMISWTWEPAGPDSVATFTLNPVHGQVHILLTHSGIKDREHQIAAAAAWHAHLVMLEAKSNNVIPPRYWDRVLRYEGEYAKQFGG